MTRTQIQRWLLLASLLTFVGSFGCSAEALPGKEEGDAAKTSSDGDNDDDGEESASGADGGTARSDSGRGAADDDEPNEDEGNDEREPDPDDDADEPDTSSPMADDDADADESDDDGDEPAASGSILPPVDDVNADGPFEVTIDEGRDYWVFRPQELGKDGLKHPVFVWGTGSTAVPSQYTDHFNRMASHGFVIVAPTPAQLSVRNMKAALNWILEENERSGSDYFGKLDPDRVGMGGHSQGSTSTFDAEADETRLKTSIHIAGGSFDGAGSSKVKTPTAYICGETDFALNNCRRDFQNVKDQPTFFSVLDGTDHIQCARTALPGMIAWLRWHLAGETERAAQFTGPDGEFFQGIWKSETKNWNF